jgi:hypothetical protein
MTTSEKTPPTAAEIESTAKEMLDLKGAMELEAAASLKIIEPKKKRFDELKLQAEQWLRDFGSAHAEKSRILHGIKFEILGTFGTSTSIDAAAVEILRLALLKAKNARLVKKLFNRVVRWELVPNWTESLRSVKLPAKIASLVAQCEVKRTKTPIITPRERAKPKDSAA